MNKARKATRIAPLMVVVVRVAPLISPRDQLTHTPLYIVDWVKSPLLSGEGEDILREMDSGRENGVSRLM